MYVACAKLNQIIKYLHIISSDLYDNNHHECKIRKVQWGDVLRHTATNTGICYVKNFKLPTFLTSKYNRFSPNYVYGMMFVLGTTKQATAYIIDVHDESNIFQLQLPSLLREIAGPSVLYSDKYGLIEIGGNISNSGKDQFNALKFNDLDNTNVSNWKWSKLDNLSRPRRYATAVINKDGDKLFLCGGYTSPPYGYYSYADMYDFNRKKWTQLPPMKYKRCRAGSYINPFMNHKVFIGGGRNASSKGVRQFEYYDMNKNQWIQLSDTNGFHGADPVIWSDHPNVLYMASTYAGMFEQLDMRQNKWTAYKEFVDMDTLFGITVARSDIACRLLIM